jgi:hypothetical protein
MVDDSISDMDLQLTLTVPGQPAVQLEQMEHAKKHEEVLGATAQAIMKERITYLEAIASEEAPGQMPGAPKPTAIAGKTYVVEAKDGALFVTDEKGAAPPSEQADLVKYAQGQKVTFPPAELAGAVQTGDTFQFVELSLTLTALSGGTASFDITMEMAADAGPLIHMTIPLEGTISVEVASGLPDEMNMEGPVSVAPPNADVATKVTGSGRMKLHNVHTYPK